jgi:hypothetical protein
LAAATTLEIEVEAVLRMDLAEGAGDASRLAAASEMAFATASRNY